MKEIAFLHFQLPAAQLPLGAQQEMKSKYFMFEFIQSSPAYETEISNIFFVFTPPNRAPILAADDFQPRLAHVLFLLEAMPESGMTGPEDLPQDAITRCFRALPGSSGAQSKSLALRTGFLRSRDGL